MNFNKRTIRQIAAMICGNFQDADTVFRYRTGSQLTQFFEDCDTDYQHFGTRETWVVDRLTDILDKEPQTNPPFPPDLFLTIIQTLMDPTDAINENKDRTKALHHLNVSLKREGFEAYVADDGKCYLRHIPSESVSKGFASPHRPFSRQENERRESLDKYLNDCSEDELIERVLLPLFRQLNFHRVTAAGHVDKALEYGKDVWMRFRLPTQQYLYFGLQAKIGKIDSAGQTAKGNANVAELVNQVVMMLGHEIFDPETNKKHLPDHAFIVSAGAITKQARNWIAGKLDQSRRSQIMFIDKDDILNLYIVANLPLPNDARPEGSAKDFDDDIPF
jgi:hypothetical protein